MKQTLSLGSCILKNNKHMKKLILLLVTSLFFNYSYSQKLKYKSDVEPLLKGSYSLHSVPKLQMYYMQNMNKEGKPTSEAMKYLRERLSKVCLHIGHSYEKYANANKNYPTTDTAVATLEYAIMWYTKIPQDLKVKSDTLQKHIAKLTANKTQWKNNQQSTIAEIKRLKESFKSTITQVQVLDNDKANELIEKHKNATLINEYKQADLDAKDLLSDLEREKRIREQQLQEAVQKKEFMEMQMKKSNAQKEFLKLQKTCEEENPCPNCPLEVAKQFREAYYSGNIDQMKSLIIDYYGDEKLFYEKDINIFKDLNPTEKSKLSSKFKAQTADYKKTEPANVVYYSDNEERDFYIDKYYKSKFLHATVFKTINDHDKVDLIKYKGKWKVYRVGGAYGGRSGNTIANGKFFFDERFLQKEIKTKKKQ